MIKIGTRFYHDSVHKKAKAFDEVIGIPTQDELVAVGLGSSVYTFYWVKYTEELGKGKEGKMIVDANAIMEKLNFYGKVSPITMKRRRI